MKKIISFITSDIPRIVAGALIFAAAIVFDICGIDVVPLILYIISLAVIGINVYIDAVAEIMRRDLLDEKFLMSIASIGAMFVGEYREGVAVMLFYLIGEAFEAHAVAGSRKKIKALMDICPDEATVLVDGKETTVDADEVSVGDTVIVRAGERVAVDSTVISGFADADTSAITGESVPVSVKFGSYIESGTIIIGGRLECRAEKTAENSSAQRILDMVENANENKAEEERFITVFARVYTPIVVSLAILLAFLPPIFKWTTLADSVYRALIFLVISCPCALVISVPLAFFGGIGTAASRGILFKGGSSFGSVAKAKNIAFDKTGTLTNGEFKIGEIISYAASKEEVISLAAAVEYGSNHPIAKAFREYVSDGVKATDIKELAGRGTIGTVLGEKVAVGNATLIESEGATIPESSAKTTDSLVFVSKNGVLIGAVELTDEIRKEAKTAIKMLRNIGISRTFMLSGDKKSRVEALKSELDIDEAKAELMPDEKYSELEKIKQSGITMYVGDGINDAPALTIANVGIAMGKGGSDSAKETADLVIMSDDLGRIPEAMHIARKTLTIARINIVFALTVKIGVMILGALGFANMWLAVFADVGVAVLAILNSMRTLIFKRHKLL